MLILKFLYQFKPLLLTFLLLPWRRLAALLWRRVAGPSCAALQGEGLGQPPLLAQLQLQLLQDKRTNQHKLICLHTPEAVGAVLHHI